MADKRESTTTLHPPVSNTGISSNLSYTKNIFVQTSPARSQLHSIVHGGLNVSQKPLYHKNNMSPRFQPTPLTGAAAIADIKEHERELERLSLPGTSPNPAARTTMMSILNQTPPMSKLTDAPPSPAALNSLKLPTITTHPPESEMIRAKSVTVASPAEMTTPVDRPLNSATPNPRKRAASPKSDGRPNKAMTYPPQRDMEEGVPRSDQASSKSPHSMKKHKCPHCSTEFTRHHNLKSHLLTHSQEKPFGCEQCISSFRRLHDLKRHIKLHTGEKSHACMKCGRKFARGDALARHNKGPGGCAGRRGSAGDGDEEEEEGISEMGQSIGGMNYHEDGDRSQYEDHEHYRDDTRRRSEPDRARSDTMNSVVSTTSGSFHQHSSTFPGLAPLSSMGLYPPSAPPSQSVAASPKEVSKHLSPKPPFSAVQYHSSTSPHSQGNIMESPKPLSPGQSDSHRGGYFTSSQPHQNRLPSRSHIGESGFGNLQLPNSQGPGTSLPSLSADPRFSQSSSGGLSMYTSPHTIAGPSSTHSTISGSTSTQAHNGSGGNFRDALNIIRTPQPPQQQPLDGTLARVQYLENTLVDSTNRWNEQERHYQAEIARLREEVAMLKAQQASAHQ